MKTEKDIKKEQYFWVRFPRVQINSLDNRALAGDIERQGLQKHLSLVLNACRLTCVTFLGAYIM